MDGFAIPLWIYAAVGVLVLWCKSKAKSRGVYALTDIVNLFVPAKYAKTRAIVEVICYLCIGCLLAMGILNPATPGQAFAAGLGFTGLTTR